VGPVGYPEPGLFPDLGLFPETESEPPPTITPGPVTRNQFTYRARDLLNWTPLDSLPYQGVGFGKILDQHGSWSGSLPLADPHVQRFDWKDATRTGRTALFVDLGGTLVWGGVIWTTAYESDDPTRSLKVTASEFGSYFQHRLQAEDYGSESELGKVWETSGGDPILIIKRIVEDAQIKEHESPGYITGTRIPIVVHGPTGEEGDLVKISYPGTSLQTVDSINSTLTALGWGPGYDFSWDCVYNSEGVPVVQLNLYRPKKGRTPEESQIVILGRDTIKWTWPEDATSQATEVVETGSGTGGGAPAYASANYPGYPLLQKATARTQITQESTLETIALGDLALCGWPVVTPTIVLPAALPGTPAAKRKTLALGEYDVGDEFVFRVDPVAAGGPNTDPRFPEGMEYALRLNQWTCTVADKGQSAVQLDSGVRALQYVPPPPPPH
jgi:hypothetical protein